MNERMGYVAPFSSLLSLPGGERSESIYLCYLFQVSGPHEGKVCSFRWVSLAFLGPPEQQATLCCSLASLHGLDLCLSPTQYKNGKRARWHTEPQERQDSRWWISHPRSFFRVQNYTVIRKLGLEDSPSCASALMHKRLKQRKWRPRKSVACYSLQCHSSLAILFLFILSALVSKCTMIYHQKNSETRVYFLILILFISYFMSQKK